jgi:hypothetical protein
VYLSFSRTKLRPPTLDALARHVAPRTITRETVALYCDIDVDTVILYVYPVSYLQGNLSAIAIWRKRRRSLTSYVSFVIFLP